MSTITAAAFSVALLATSPPPAGQHATTSKVVLTWDYMKRWKQTTPAAVATCGGCHMTIVPAKKFRGIAGLGYGGTTPVPIAPSILLFAAGLAAIASTRRVK